MLLLTTIPAKDTTTTPCIMAEKGRLNKNNKTSCWNKLKYHNMDYIKDIINKYFKITFKNADNLLLI